MHINFGRHHVASPRSTPIDYGNAFAEGYGGVSIIPSVFVNDVRNLLRRQGIDPAIITNSGEIDPSALIALAFDRIEFSTTLTPPMKINLREPADPKSQTGALVKSIKPTLRLYGAAGNIVIAPFGVAKDVTNIYTMLKIVGLGALMALVGGALIVRSL